MNINQFFSVTEIPHVTQTVRAVYPAWRNRSRQVRLTVSLRFYKTAQALDKLNCQQAVEDLENDIKAGYVLGNASIYRDESQVKSGSSGYFSMGEWPIGGGRGTPIDHLAFTGVNIDHKPKIGKVWTDSKNLGAVSARGRSEIAGVNESVTIPAGTFENCLFIRLEFVSSAENKLAPERETWEGYLAGTRLLWFASGVGLVKCQYEHANGAVTDLHLLECSVKEGNDDYIPLDVGNWWRHEWTEKRSRASFMQLTRVVAEEKKNGMQVFHLSFMTHGMKMTIEPQIS